MDKFLKHNTTQINKILKKRLEMLIKRIENKIPNNGDLDTNAKLNTKASEIKKKINDITY